MSITGAPDGEPMKVGVGIADVMCGMYAAVAILAALRHRGPTGEGQHIDMALLDTQVAWLVNEGMNYLLSGRVPTRLGNEHPNIVPYKVVRSADGQVMLAVGNDVQCQHWCRFAGAEELAADPRFTTNRRACATAASSTGRCLLVRRRDHGRVGQGAGRTGRALRPGQRYRPGVRRRAGPGARHASGPAAPAGRRGTVPIIANPIRMTATPPGYRSAPPTLGQHTREVLGELLGFDGAALSVLAEDGVIA